MGILTSKPDVFKPVLMRPAKTVMFTACCKTCIHHKRQIIGDWEYSFELHKCDLGAPDKNLDNMQTVRNLTDHFCDNWMPNQYLVNDELNREESNHE